MQFMTLLVKKQNAVAAMAILMSSCLFLNAQGAAQKLSQPQADSLQESLSALQKQTSQIRAMLEEMKAELLESRAEVVEVRQQLEMTRQQLSAVLQDKEKPQPAKEAAFDAPAAIEIQNAEQPLQRLEEEQESQILL